ncbi:MAG: hypothetical protein KatS3mg119_1454 [Rhodothalassiaceae bacterium]|nr:MAG: hypothetical protein KatS3mg119_1454 [Rhodothalassiaceae bacterium]
MAPCPILTGRLWRATQNGGVKVLQKLSASAMPGETPSPLPATDADPGVNTDLAGLGRAVEAWPALALLCAFPDADLPPQLLAASPAARSRFSLPRGMRRTALELRSDHPLSPALRAARARLMAMAADAGSAAPASFTLAAPGWTVEAALLGGRPHGPVLLTLIEAPRGQDAAAANRDPLTGLLDRDGFLGALEEAIARGREGGGDCAVLLINLDRFQRVNESFGHARGDAVLVDIAGRLAGFAGEGEAVGRLSGDEFALLLTAPDGVVEAARACAERIRAVIGVPVTVGGEELHLSACIGIATTATGSCHPTDLLRDADVAVHRAKARGRGHVDLYVRERRLLPLSPLQMEGALRRALASGEGLHLAYQPIVELGAGRIFGFEALARWTHPALGPVSPAQFIPLAEDAGLIDALGEWALETACATLARWRRKFAPGRRLSVSVNVSGHQFHDPGLARRICGTIARHGLDGPAVRLEITESVLIREPEQAAATLKALHDEGVLIALDDFGTGYSSLNYLHRFPISFVKIDRSFCLDLEHEPERQQLVKGLAALADTLGLVLIAEGIERCAQVDLLRRLGCRMGQGFYFARPLPEGEALALFLREERAPHRS